MKNLGSNSLPANRGLVDRQLHVRGPAEPIVLPSTGERWDCRRCGKRGLLPEHHACPACGHINERQWATEELRKLERRQE